MAAKSGSKRTIKKPGSKPISFKTGGLHKSVGVPQGKPIPKAKMDAAARGDYGPKAKKQAQFAQNVLTGPKPKTAAKPFPGAAAPFTPKTARKATRKK